MTHDQTRSNSLRLEKSPYLLAHADNPVDWRPWSDTAFAEAKSKDVPIFLSIGYHTCHWCHVMERESFSDQDVAAILNRGFIPIKVDREERPDVDEVYMKAAIAMIGEGGWPLNLILTPEKRPFFAATYLPKEQKHGRSGLVDVLNRISEAWQEDRESLVLFGDRVTGYIADEPESQLADLDAGVHERAYGLIRKTYDRTYGGFGSEPKFPLPQYLYFLLRYSRAEPESDGLEMVLTTLRSMRGGGIYDQLAGGFARYSTDRGWGIPHFEKMLYDNAHMAMVCIEAYQASGDSGLLEVAKDTLDFLLREMKLDEGGFASGIDADSEGAEGRFYLFSESEVEGVLGKDIGSAFCERFGVGIGPALDGKYVLRKIDSSQPSDLDAEGLDRARQALLRYRSQRIPPAIDDKVVTGWNCLAASALARGSSAMGHEPYLIAAKATVDLILKRLLTDEGRLLIRYRDGDAAHLATLDDYAMLVQSLLDIYNADFSPQWFKYAMHFQSEQDRLFRDSDTGTYYLSGSDSEQLLIRSRDGSDGPMPSGNSITAMNLLRLGLLTGDPAYTSKANHLVSGFGSQIRRSPLSYLHLLSAHRHMITETPRAVVACNSVAPALPVLAKLSSKFIPEAALIYILSSEMQSRLSGVIAEAEAYDLADKPVFHVCTGAKCMAPTDSEMEFLEMMGSPTASDLV